MRLWFTEEDAETRARMARTALGTVAVVTTLVALARAAVRGAARRRAVQPARRGHRPPRDPRALELHEPRDGLRAPARGGAPARRSSRASMANVLLTVALTVTLVVFLDGGAHGYLAGNYAASAVVLLGHLGDRGAADRGARRRATRSARCSATGCRSCRRRRRSSRSTSIDRAYLLRAESAAAAGLFALAVKLATVVIVAVRAFGLAWPPLAYSVTDDDEARRLYATVTTWYVVIIGLVVLGLALLSRWIVDLLAAPDFAAAHEALGWVALGWGLYGLALLLVTVAGPRAHHDPQRAGRVRRARRERRRAAPARPAARDRRGGDRALRRLRRHARGPAPADARALPRPVRVGPSRSGDARPGRRGARRRAPPARRRGRRAGVARRARRARARRPVSHRIPAS